MKFKTDPEALVLGVLAEEPLHGYSIVKSIQKASGGMFKMQEGQLYPLLHRMQKAGWIKGEWEATETGPARKTYHLLDPGKKELEARRAEWKKFAGAVVGILNPAVGPSNV